MLAVNSLCKYCKSIGYWLAAAAVNCYVVSPDEHASAIIVRDLHRAYLSAFARERSAQGLLIRPTGQNRIDAALIIASRHQNPELAQKQVLGSIIAAAVSRSLLWAAADAS